jgi:hypothetical protein
MRPCFSNRYPTGMSQKNQFGFDTSVLHHMLLLTGQILTHRSTNQESSLVTTPSQSSTLKSSPPAPPLHPKPSNPTQTSTTKRCTKTPHPPSQAQLLETFIQVSATQVKVRRRMSYAIQTRRSELDLQVGQIVLSRAISEA